jgi:hypothetical protein
MKYSAAGLVTDFDSKQAAAKTVDEFIQHEKHLGFTDAQLKEAHALCVKEAAPKKVKEPTPKVSEPDK